jgi:hypothetical protein
MRHPWASALAVSMVGDVSPDIDRHLKPPWVGHDAVHVGGLRGGGRQAHLTTLRASPSRFR